MGIAKLVHAPGDAVDYTPVGAVSTGELVELTNVVGVAVTDLAAGQKGAAYVKNRIVRVPKEGGGGITFEQGAPVYFDAAASAGEDAAVDDDSGANLQIGRAAYAAADADTYVDTVLGWF